MMVQTVEIIKKMQSDGVINERECSLVTDSWQETGVRKIK